MPLTVIRGGLLAASALLALLAAAASASPALQPPQAKPAHHAVRSAGNRALAVLYDQTGNPSGFGTVSQDFGDNFTSQAADDFTVPEGTKWTIREIDVPGAYFNGSGPDTQIGVAVYKDKHNKPGKIVASLDVAPASDDSGSFVLELRDAIKLKPGHYWLSIVPVGDFAVVGQWFWENQTKGTREGSPAMWQNPGDGYGSGCTKWTAETKCVPNKFGDQMFTLKGTAK